MDANYKYLTGELAKVEWEIEKTRELLGELGEEAEKELAKLEGQKKVLEESIRAGSFGELRTVEQESFNSVIVEVRPGVGGDEAKIWAENVARMYSRFAEFNNWSVVQLDGGVIKIKGNGVWEKMKCETGVHRVQRVPETEASGRVHTSTASVVVLPEVTEREIEIKEDDLAWEFSRSGGHGGQNVNKVATAVRLTHKPTALVVACRQERSQEQNRKIALTMLRSRLWEREQENRRAGERERRSLVGRSMRAEKIRTYNYPQNRVTDHRVGKSWHRLDKIIDGDLAEVLEYVRATI